MIAVVGGSGFVGRRIVEHLSLIADVVEVAAPRLTSAAKSVSGIHRDAAGIDFPLPSADVVVNAAGLATPGSQASSALTGANALLPVILARSAQRNGSRLIHLSSAAVQGRARVLDCEATYAPETPYARSKVLGEMVLMSMGLQGLTIHRATSVHGVGRATTMALARTAKHPAVMVAAPGDDPSPQVHVESVARAIATIVMSESAPMLTLQPSEGITTSGIVRILGGREPRLVPRGVARVAVERAYDLSRLGSHTRLHAQARRLEMLLFGQQQAPGWLELADGNLNRPASGWQELRP